MRLIQLGLSALFTLASLPASAQEPGQPGFDIGWNSGISAVPLGGWATVLISLSLLAAASVCFRRRKTSGGLLSLCLSGMLMLVAYQQDGLAINFGQELIDTPSGSTFLSCDGNTPAWEVSTNLASGIVFSRINLQFGLMPTITPMSEPDNTCTVNEHLMPDESCILVCPPIDILPPPDQQG